ncbi:hypothetical protein N752_05690 [Desulforamulus aquiferis]|nr:hypothetical protein [Desulforamulus aquiferis]RYD06140.1 hypothetical protein N752_05690 [Desulforamulus aquiferis]
MKKLSILILFSFLLSLFVTTGSLAFAQNDTEMKINEYQKLKDLKAKTDEELEEIGLSTKEIEEIKKLDYAKELQKRAKLDKKLLKNLGYSDEQVSMLKNFQGTESEIVALAATLTISASKNEWSYDSSTNTTYFRVGFSWKWSSCPVIKMTDIVAAGWSPEMYQDTSWNSTNHRVTYFDADSGQNTTKNYNVDVGQAGRGAYSKFPVSTSMWNWATSGSGFFRVSKVGKVPEAAMKISYGHQTVSGTPTVSFPAAGSITFSYHLNEEGYAYVKVP